VNPTHLHLATRTKVITFKSALDMGAAPPAVTVSTNVRPLTLEEVRSAAAQYQPPVDARATLASSIDVTDAPDLILAPAAVKAPSVRPAAPGAPLPAMPLPTTRSRSGFSARSLSKQVVFGLAAFGALVAVGSAGVAVKMQMGVDRVASARTLEPAGERPAALPEVAAPLQAQGNGPAAPASTGNKDLDDALRAANAANKALESSLH